MVGSSKIHLEGNRGHSLREKKYNEVKMWDDVAKYSENAVDSYEKGNYKEAYKSDLIVNMINARLFCSIKEEELLKDNMIILIREIKDLAIYEEGYEAILAGQPQIGLPLLEGLIELYPQWWNLHFFLGLGNRQRGDYEVAINHFLEVLNIRDNQLDTLVEIGLCHYGLGNNDEAIDYFTLALEIGGDNSEILSNLAIAYIEVENYTLAKECLEKSLDINSDDEITKLAYKNLMEIMKK